MGRHTIRPEICRTFHFGARGVSNAQYSKYLNSIKLNDEFIRFGALDLSYLEKDVWDSSYLSAVRGSTEVSKASIASVPENEVRVVYDRISEGLEPGAFGEAARWLGAMNNIKAMVPRTAYKGVVTVWNGNKIVHIAPASLFGKRMK